MFGKAKNLIGIRFQPAKTPCESDSSSKADVEKVSADDSAQPPSCAAAASHGASSSKSRFGPGRKGFGGATVTAEFCKNSECGTLRDNMFRGGLCGDCERGFRRKGRSRAEDQWTQEMKRAVAEESKKAREKRARARLTQVEEQLLSNQKEILAALHRLEGPDVD